jgi:hypothetical protein
MQHLLAVIFVITMMVMATDDLCVTSEIKWATPSIHLSSSIHQSGMGLLLVLPVFLWPFKLDLLMSPGAGGGWIRTLPFIIYLGPCLDWFVSPPSSYIDILMLWPQNLTLFWNRVHVNAIRYVKMGPCWKVRAQFSMTGVLMSRGIVDTGRCAHRENATWRSEICCQS